MTRRCRMPFTVLAALFLLFATTPLASAAQPPPASPQERLDALLRPSIVYLDISMSGYLVGENQTFGANIPSAADPNLRPLTVAGHCTGFVINPQGYIATAGHCVSNEDMTAAIIHQWSVDNISANPGYTLETLEQHAIANYHVEGQASNSPPVLTVTAYSGENVQSAKQMPARRVDVRPSTAEDVALLKVDTPGLPSMGISTGDVPIGSPVTAIGYPGSTTEATGDLNNLQPSFKEGSISSKTQVNGTTPFWETSAPITTGMSGGPTVGSDGNAVGVTSFKPGTETQPFNFIAPASSLNELLARNGVRSELAPADVAYRSGLDAYYAGRYSEAIDDFDRVTALEPINVQAAEFKTKAFTARDQYGDSDALGVVGWVLVIGGAVALFALLALGAVLIVRRRRRARGSAATAAPLSPPYGMPQPPHGYVPNAGYPPHGAPPFGTSPYGFPAASGAASTQEGGAGQYGAGPAGSAYGWSGPWTPAQGQPFGDPGVGANGSVPVPRVSSESSDRSSQLVGSAPGGGSREPETAGVPGAGPVAGPSSSGPGSCAGCGAATGSSKFCGECGRRHD